MVESEQTSLNNKYSCQLKRQLDHEMVPKLTHQITYQN